MIPTGKFSMKDIKNAVHMIKNPPVDTYSNNKSTYNNDKKLKVLIYTDSRGEHVPKGSSHTIYTQRLKNDPRLDVTLYLCPLKWTTNLDFLEMVYDKNIKLHEYDLVILHTGIVEYSPRHKSSAINQLYNNPAGKHNYNIPKKYAGRIVNAKKEIFDKVFGAKAMQQHFNTSLNVKYEGDDTLNMYNLEMAEKKLIPILQKIPNLLWISSNNIVKGWNGNYFRKRPSNIHLIEEYSKLFVDKLPRVLNLHTWSDEDVKKYTCDNMHLSTEGSEYIFNEIIKIVNIIIQNKDTLVVMGNGPSLRQVNIDHLRYVDTFGLNMAHRIYDDISFYPTYFGCFDYKVTDYHKESFQKLIDTLPTKRFFFIRNYFKGNNVTSIKLDHNKRDFLVDEKDINKLWNMGNSGSNACHVGIAMGYKKIILVGVDCSYVNILPEAKLMKNGTLRIMKTPTKNPNYWFDGYQQEGDIYNVPNSDIYHQPGWVLLSKLARENNIKVVNCSPKTTLKCFPISTIADELSITDKLSATIIFNVKHNPNINKNLEYVLKWFYDNFSNQFEYLIIEQDTKSKITINQEIYDKLNIKKVLLYNPDYFNRGWGFNVAVKHYINTSVAVFCDTDIILDKPENLIKSIKMCMEDNILVSPYKYVHFTTREERSSILNNTFSIDLESKYPVSISGGMSVINVNAYNKLGGFEEYTVYGGEDRSLDVLFQTFYKTKMIEGYGIHLYHPSNRNTTKKFKDKSRNMIKHLKSTYNCIYDRSLDNYDFIHKNCKHKTVNTLLPYIQNKIKYYGDTELYRSDRVKYVNGIPN